MINGTNPKLHSYQQTGTKIKYLPKNANNKINAENFQKPCEYLGISLDPRLNRVRHARINIEINFKCK